MWWMVSFFCLHICSRWFVGCLNIYGRRVKGTDVEVGFNAIMVKLKLVCNSTFSMDIVIKSNNNPVNYMIILMSGLINELEKVIKTKSTQCLFSY